MSVIFERFDGLQPWSSKSTAYRARAWILYSCSFKLASLSQSGKALVCLLPRRVASRPARALGPPPARAAQALALASWRQPLSSW
jgi:hypothetical protein